MASVIQPVRLESLGEPLAGTLFLPEPSKPAPVLIICHGAGEYKEHFYELCEFLAKRGVASLALDMHGHGESGGDRFHVNIGAWVADVRAAVDFLSGDRRIDANRIGAFGLSSGGTAILEAALIEPKLKALVVLDATVRNSMPLLPTLVLKSLVIAGKINKALTKRDLRLPLLKLLGGLEVASDPEINERLQKDPKAIEAFMAFPLPGAAESIFVNTIQRVSGISIPALILWGKDDKLDPPETAQLLFNALTCKKQLHIIEGNGHVGHLDRNRERVFALTTDWALQNLL